MREYRKQVIRETLDALEQGFYTAPSGKRVDLDLDAQCLNASQGVLHAAPTLTHPSPWPRASGDAALRVIEGDCITHALALQDDGLNPVCLNMANAKRPGGGYLNGAGAQEENLFRRSAYALFLDDGPHRSPRVRYPLPEFGGAYSREVAVFRGEEQHRYPFFEAPRALSFVAVAAYDKPPVMMTGFGPMLRPDYADKTRGKIRAIFDIALAHGHDAIVLSAFGCGAFGNPPRHVARLFREVIDDEDYGRAFKAISFAIIDDHNAIRKGSTEGNVKPFQQAFGV